MMRTAVVVFNLGGPDSPDAVQPFLFNLFNDPAIIRAPGPVRWALAHLISRRRAPIAREIYATIGGRSPLLENTQAQAQALTSALTDLGEVKTVIAMRYWHPRAEAAVAEVAAFRPDRVVLLPLYPQFSTTTSASSLGEWTKLAAAAGITAPTSAVCCYPTEAGFIAGVAARVRAAVAEAAAHGRPRVLFSAHGLPEKIVAGGDPYQWQVEQSAAAVVAALADPALDSVVCYQSRVGPLKWIGPSTDDEIQRAGRDGVPLVVCPIAFVSEHSETLVEIEQEYRELAHEAGVPSFHRVDTVGDDPHFITGLAGLVREALQRDPGTCPQGGTRLCAKSWTGCPAVIP
ncbi:MAG: ferrochelatase [Alphaproteobacteria bacterium]|nr:ferrochelatase [Alphaproteobacteria bacterium]